MTCKDCGNEVDYSTLCDTCQAKVRRSMSQYKIDKGIQITDRLGMKFRFPFGQMAIGDSFSVKLSRKDSLKSSAQYYRKRHSEFRFLTRKSANSIRIWRIPCETEEGKDDL